MPKFAIEDFIRPIEWAAGSIRTSAYRRRHQGRWPRRFGAGQVIGPNRRARRPGRSRAAPPCGVEKVLCRCSAARQSPIARSNDADSAFIFAPSPYIRPPHACTRFTTLPDAFQTGRAYSDWSASGRRRYHRTPYAAREIDVAARVRRQLLDDQALIAVEAGFVPCGRIRI